MSEKLSEFYRTIQFGLQNHIHHVLAEVDPLAGEAQASIGDVSFCFGSVFASVLFELLREPDVIEMTAQQQQHAIEMMEPFVDGFSEKLALLVNPNPDKMEVIHQ